MFPRPKGCKKKEEEVLLQQNEYPFPPLLPDDIIFPAAVAIQGGRVPHLEGSVAEKFPMSRHSGAAPSPNLT